MIRSIRRALLGEPRGSALGNKPSGGALRQEERIADLEQALDQTRRDLSECLVDMAGLQRRSNATSMYFEARVDLIYRRVSVDLQSLLGMAKIDSIPDVEVDMQIARLLNASWDAPPSMPVDLKAALSPEIRPGLIKSPLTLQGFRLNRKRARDCGEYVRLNGLESGIAVYGPYKLLRPGKYQLKAIVGLCDGGAGEARGLSEVALDVVSSELGRPIAASSAQIGNLPSETLLVDFVWDGGAVEFRIHQSVGAELDLVGFDLTRI